MNNSNYDFSCWLIKYDTVTIRDLIYRKNSLKRNDNMIVPLLWEHCHTDSSAVLGHALLEHRDEGIYVYGVLRDNSDSEVAKRILLNGYAQLFVSPYITQIKYDKNFIVDGVIQEVSLILCRIDPDEAYRPVMKGEKND